MLYVVIKAKIRNDGEVVEGKRKILKVWPQKLKTGGLYFLDYKVRGKELYRVIGEIPQ